MNKEKLESDILQLLYDYSIKEKSIDKKYIKTIIEISKMNMDLEEYIIRYGIKKENYDKYVSATYSIIEKKITIYEKNLKKSIQSKSDNKKYLTELENKFYENVILTQTIFHEIEHANQHRMIDKENTMEAKILNLCMNNFNKIKEINEIVQEALRTKMVTEKEIQQYYDFTSNIKYATYKNYYELAPQERLAEIKSHKKMINILSEIKTEIPQIIKYESICIGKNMLKGYTNEIFSPTIKYITECNRKIGLNMFDWYDENTEKTRKLAEQKYDLETRLKYGLPITKEEYQAIKTLK